MSIERNPSADRAADARLQDNQKGREAERAPPPREQVDRFRDVLRQAGQSNQDAKLAFADARQQQAGELRGESRTESAQIARAAAEEGLRVDAVGARGEDASETARQQVLEATEIMAMMQAQSALRDGGAPAMPAPPSMNAGTFSDLLERHVRQLAVAGGQGAQASDGQVLLRMADATLPGTDLLLTRTETGWLLKADTRSRGSYDAIREAAPELARRFAERDLGELQIDPQLHS